MIHESPVTKREEKKRSLVVQTPLELTLKKRKFQEKDPFDIKKQASEHIKSKRQACLKIQTNSELLCQELNLTATDWLNIAD